MHQRFPKLSDLGKKHGRHRYTPEFEQVWDAYSKRSGGNSKPNAYAAWRGQVVSGVPLQELEAGTQRYAAWCKKAGKIDGEYVKQASTFFGTGEHWLEDWAVSGGAPEPALANLRAL